ncbi:hypothetical protein [Microbacterium sp.]|uniref:hypothetical protein n=1 Tax=Microbacterium sp. TaxID=51671 RepID=UPI003F70F015
MNPEQPTHADLQKLAIQDGAADQHDAEEVDKLIATSGRGFRQLRRLYESRARRATKPQAPLTGRMSAREWFAYLRPVLLASRPIVGERTLLHVRDSKGRPKVEPIYGPPTFRNVIDEDGHHV